MKPLTKQRAMSLFAFLQFPTLTRHFMALSYESFKGFFTSSKHSTNRLVISLAAVCAAGYYLTSKKPVNEDQVYTGDDPVLKLLKKIDDLSKSSPPSGALQAIDTHRKVIAALKLKLQALIQKMILEYYQLEEEKINDEKQFKHFTKDHGELMRNFSEKSTKVHSMLKALTEHKKSLWANIQGSKKVAKDFQKIYAECYDTAFKNRLEEYHHLVQAFSCAYFAIFETTHQHLLEAIDMNSDTYDSNIEAFSLKFQSTHAEMLSGLEQSLSENKGDILDGLRDLLNRSLQSFQQNAASIGAIRKVKSNLDDLSKDLKDLTESNSTRSGHNTIASLELLSEQLNTYELDLLTHDKTNLFHTVVEFIERHADYCQTLKTEVSSLLTINQIIDSPSGKDSPEKGAVEVTSPLLAGTQQAKGNTGEHSPTSIDQQLTNSMSGAHVIPMPSGAFTTPERKQTAPSQLTEAALRALNAESQDNRQLQNPNYMFGKIQLIPGDASSTGSVRSPSSSVTNTADFL